MLLIFMIFHNDVVDFHLLGPHSFLTVVFAPVGACEPAAGQNQKDRAGKVPQHHKFGVAENPFGDDATEDKKDEQKKV